MAKPKVSTYTEKIAEFCYNLWVDQPAKYVSEIESIEGVSKIIYLSSTKPILILIDKRYDAAEVMEEIITLLSAEVPDIFKEK